MTDLPIDPLLPEIVRALSQHAALVIEAPPGAGKTTRVPPALLAADFARDQEVLVLEPRRLATRLAAQRVAQEMGEQVGGTVGYQVRFEEVASPRTRLRFITHGLLARRLLSRPDLAGVAAVVLDEFHERPLATDLALALVKRLQQSQRPELKLVVMSATLDTAALAQYLNAPVVRSQGRQFDVDIEYIPAVEVARPDVPLERRVAAAVRRLVAEGLEGDVLVFLPGAAEIRRSMAACTTIADDAGIELAALHGDLSPEQQDRAIRTGQRPKVIFSTNVAETSVTIEGVVAVIDSGLARVASHSPWSGLPRLTVKKVSRASAAQRAGRAGRLRAGRVLRLYTRHDHDSRPEFDVPEIQREDLGETVLTVAALGATGGALQWLEPPPEPALRAAHELLALLGALDRGGSLTELGRRLLAFPLHPRQGRLLVEAEARGVGDEGCLLAALLGERDIRAPDLTQRPSPFGSSVGSPSTAMSGDSDLLELAALFTRAQQARFAPDAVRALGLRLGATLAVDRSRRQLLQLSRRRPSRPRSNPPAISASQREDALRLATLAAYPDRVARRRGESSDELVLVGGGSAQLAPQSVVHASALVVAIDVEERQTTPVRPLARPTSHAGSNRTGGSSGAIGRPSAQVTVRIASAVGEEDLLELFPDELRFSNAVSWNAEAERVDSSEQLLYRDLVLSERRATHADAQQVAALLAQEALAKGPRAFGDPAALEQLMARLAFVARTYPNSGIAPPQEEQMQALLARLCQGRRSFAELREVGLDGAVLDELKAGDRSFVHRVAPLRCSLPGGRNVRIEYPAGNQAPYIASRLQDFFGMAQAPQIADGRVTLVLHLLAPNGRPVQVTSDLAGFWQRHYPALRRELGRRYPRHAWPENPLTAAPRSKPPR